MFVAVYLFRVKPGMEEQFRQAWAERTREIIKESGSLGSRLHRNEDGAFVAYAQWSSRKAWQDASTSETIARQQMRQATLSSETVFCLDLLENLFVDPQ
jgi:quinol monooxygenase YgiN